MSFNLLVSFKSPGSAGGPVFTDSFTQTYQAIQQTQTLKIERGKRAQQTQGQGAGPAAPSGASLLFTLGFGRRRVPVVHDSARHTLVPLPDPVPGLLPPREGCYLSNKMICKIFKSL